jgi:signal transduction histidine kinase
MPIFSGPAPGGDVQLGVGTAGMRERVAQLNGVFEIKSALGQGTVVGAVFPAPINQENHTSNKKEV